MAKTTAQLINGKALAERILLELKGKVSQLSRPPGLATILIGNDSASQLYVKKKKEACHKVGIKFHNYLCGRECCPDITEEKILEMIEFLNNDPNTDGIIVQLPLPPKYNSNKIIKAIDPQKDVDGFHPENAKKFLWEMPSIVSPLIQAVNTALTATKESLKGKTAVIVARNSIFSDLLKKDLENQGLEVKIAKPDKNLPEITKTADVLIVILGQKHFIKKSMVKKNAIVIDIGTNLIGKKKWAGDVDPKVAEVAGWLTPVPGGIGPLTVSMLLKNVYHLALINNKKAKFSESRPALECGE